MQARSSGAPRSEAIAYSCDCGQTYQATIHHAVNITLEPRLLYELLSSRLNRAICPNCGREIASELPFLYHDMKRGLFAYVHPDATLAEEDREALLEQLRQVYTLAVRQSDELRPERPTGAGRRATAGAQDAAEALAHVTEPDAPPMQVIFGVPQLVTLVNSLLEPEERLGHIALNSTSGDPATRARFLSVARQLADQMSCLVDASERANGLHVEIYGPRGRIAQFVAALRTLL
ncbi:MAG TPA: CpXC domain-containing protein [Ktedonobacterales bacterium]|nr:CpXC domain-containing protein [Ktedonobacterales bacterium]